MRLGGHKYLSTMTYRQLSLPFLLLLLSLLTVTATSTVTATATSTATSTDTATADASDNITTSTTTTQSSGGGSGGSSSQAKSDLPQIAIVISVIAVVVLMGIGIAKGAEHCYARSSIRDDASDISEGTKAILRQHIELMKKKPENPKKTASSEDTTKKVLNVWGRAKSGLPKKEEENTSTTNVVPDESKCNDSNGANNNKMTPVVKVTLEKEKMELQSLSSKDSDSEKALLSSTGANKDGGNQTCSSSDQNNGDNKITKTSNEAVKLSEEKGKEVPSINIQKSSPTKT